MRPLSIFACFSTLVLFFLISSESASAAAQIFRQGPCVTLPDYWCKSFVGNPVTSLIVRRFDFNLPSAGTAEVTFTGTAICRKNVALDLTIDFSSQIQLTTSGVAN